MNTLTSRHQRTEKYVKQAEPNHSAHWMRWVIGLQMTHQLLLKQLELSLANYEREGEFLTEVFIGLSERGGSLCDTNNADWLDRSLAVLQDRDLVQQQLDGVRKTLVLLESFIEDTLNAQSNGDPLPGFDQLIQRIYESYVMSAQRELHHQITGFRQGAESVEKMQFF